MRTDYILKLSKLCNLRCEYCYEYAELDDPRFLRREQLRTLFQRIAEHHEGRGPDEHVEFIFHGGEPLLRGPAYLDMIFEEQAAAFRGRALSVTNMVQTNLTRLDAAMIAALRRFDGVGVSFDPLGGHRVDIAGNDARDRVLENIRALRAAGLQVGCITLLTKRTLPLVDAIFDFFAEEGLSFRLLPLSRGATPAQHRAYAITAAETRDALCRVFDRWLASESTISVDPWTTRTLEDLASAENGNLPPRYYDRRSHEQIILVGTNGDVYNSADVHLPGAVWGNLFRQPLDEILASAEREASVYRAELRMAQNCVSCPHFGVCTGDAMAEEHNDFPDILAMGSVRCVVQRGVLDHIARRLRGARDALPADASVTSIHPDRAPAAL